MKLKFYILRSWDPVVEGWESIDNVAYASKRAALAAAHEDRRNGWDVDVQRIVTSDLSPLKLLMRAVTTSPGQHDHLGGWIAERETIYRAEGARGGEVR